MKKRIVIAVNVEEDSIISRLEKLGNDADKLAREARRLMFELESDEENAMQNKPVSYTHLDVYKRQDGEEATWSKPNAG